jgi:glutamine amidotransferase
VIALLDYGAGNLTSVRKAFAALGAAIDTPRLPSQLAGARAIVVPGVGHFERTAAIDEPWRVALRAHVAAGVPFLGICLGMQWLFEGSAEAPGIRGLGIFHGMCERIPAAKVPHVGWNSLALSRPTVLTANIPDESQVYFTHSYAAPVVEATAAVTTYGVSFSAAVEQRNIAGVQFHPEKSGVVGLQLLRNWLDAV